jgi:hypothetical protein
MDTPERSIPSSLRTDSSVPRKPGTTSDDATIGTSTAVDTPIGAVSRSLNPDRIAREIICATETTTSPTLADDKKTSEPHLSWQETAQALTDQALQFLSTASNETIGACLVGLSATTYLLLGRVGLVLMGVVGGVVLHATWEGSHNSSVAEARADEERRRKEIGLDVVKRALAWRDQVRDREAGEEAGEEAETRIELFGGKRVDFSNLPPESAAALTELTDAVVRDYVK